MCKLNVDILFVKVCKHLVFLSLKAQSTTTPNTQNSIPVLFKFPTRSLEERLDSTCKLAYNCFMGLWLSISICRQFQNNMALNLQCETPLTG